MGHLYKDVFKGIAPTPTSTTNSQMIHITHTQQETMNGEFFAVVLSGNIR